MSRDEQRVNGDELKALAYRAARHRLNPFVRLSGSVYALLALQRSNRNPPNDSPLFPNEGEGDAASLSDSRG